MKYTYSLFLLLAASLLYSPDRDSNTLKLLYIFLALAALGALFDYASAYASFRAWLHRFFQEKKNESLHPKDTKYTITHVPYANEREDASRVLYCKGVMMPNAQMKVSSNKKKTKKQQEQTKETLTPLDVMEKKIKQRSFKDKKTLLDERTLNPRAKELLEELSTELGLSKEVIADLAITFYWLYKDKV